MFSVHLQGPRHDARADRRESACRPGGRKTSRWARVGLPLILVGWMAVEAPSVSGQTPDGLAAQLFQEGDYTQAAIEFRRLALDAAGDPSARAVYFWSAAHAYWKAGELARLETMLTRAEDADASIEQAALLLRGEAALEAGQWNEAAFYFASMRRGAASDTQEADYASRRMAVTALRDGDAAAARARLRASGLPRAEAAVNRYAEGRDKSPTLGGALGLVPGLGYMYSGEYGNGFRSLLINGLFIFGMAYSADEGHWGAFAVISFFEITWYSGSIYGGIDAAHRYNRRRLREAERGVMEGAAFRQDVEALPGLRLNYVF